jgi:hypothetical protein
MTQALYAHMNNKKIKIKNNNNNKNQTQIRGALVAHACNPSYSGGRDQESTVQIQPWANSS